MNFSPQLEDYGGLQPKWSSKRLPNPYMVILWLRIIMKTNLRTSNHSAARKYSSPITTHNKKENKVFWLMITCAPPQTLNTKISINSSSLRYTSWNGEYYDKRSLFCCCLIAQKPEAASRNKQISLITSWRCSWYERHTEKHQTSDKHENSLNCNASSIRFCIQFKKWNCQII